MPESWQIVGRMTEANDEERLSAFFAVRSEAESMGSSGCFWLCLKAGKMPFGVNEG